MRNISTKHRVVAGAVTLLVLGVVGFVYAAWTTNGSGSGYAQAGTAQSLSTVDVSASTTASLYPGQDGNVLIKVHNPNPYNVQVQTITGNGTITADSGHSTCGSDGSHPTGVTFTNQSGLSISVSANSDTQTTLTGAAHMSNSADNSCQGATFTIPASLGGTSN